MDIQANTLSSNTVIVKNNITVNGQDIKLWLQQKINEVINQNQLTSFSSIEASTPKFGIEKKMTYRQFLHLPTSILPEKFNCIQIPIGLGTTAVSDDVYIILHKEDTDESIVAKSQNACRINKGGLLTYKFDTLLKSQFETTSNKFIIECTTTLTDNWQNRVCIPLFVYDHQQDLEAQYILTFGNHYSTHPDAEVGNGTQELKGYVPEMTFRCVDTVPKWFTPEYLNYIGFDPSIDFTSKEF